ncbi:RNA polymerase sigma factor [Clostridium tetanomorphum]|uniref:RNA polymerase sigma factor SigI n=1 Tax=Clostridium tetanomorphum TaxID=1553 RepID=A0A923EC92_CLOTT|nr:sigma factor [Clostridium tetanomorphum]KAJ53093.1 RNA polymerase sigma factor SigI [Clostridium tetanomorphum DSM 665]MBC2398369.1 RNA polymerase subunit sigma-28 [Clostridium tetanomorphum]MBP1865522.1 RNA polymerase sigma factor [Clostridium tetanomorphum]NRS86468.1 RNA polymerase sigma factor [Clostridium tetanomorphum]NRZ95503.1 RNA polymerase sigma factor [Clostridium tetanomorphum]
MDLKKQLDNDRDAFIEKNKKFIYDTTYNICKKRLQWENDDELSIAMIAFNKACDSYNENRGNFFSYARVLIKNALINYFKKTSLKTYLIFNNDEDLNYIDLKNSLNAYEIRVENEKRAEEIKLFSIELSKYNISFGELSKFSPSHKDTKDNLLNIAIRCIDNDEIMIYIRRNKMLPIKQIAVLTGAKKKLLEKWRKYLISLILVLSNDEYLYLKSYLDLKVGEVIEG